MKKLIALFLTLSIFFSFASCGTEPENDEVNDSKSNAESFDTYKNIAFDNLKTFTEIAGTALNSTVEDETTTTTFCYVVFEEAEPKIIAYKTYLTEYGFIMTSDIDDETAVFTLNEKEISISSESGSSGTTIEIIIPCDKSTNAARKEKAYQELMVAIDEKNFQKAYNITDQFSSDEIQQYKDVYACRLFSIAMKAYDKHVYGTSSEEFKKYLEVQPEDKLGAKAYIQECDALMSKYNGTYSGKKFDGTVYYYMIIKDGKIGFEFNDREFGYNLGEPVYYDYDLCIVQYENGIVSLSAGYYDWEKMNYKNGYKITVLDNGNLIVNDFLWDPLYGYNNDPRPFAGEYKRIADAPPSK